MYVGKALMVGKELIEGAGVVSSAVGTGGWEG
jgi:hypothetical protein